VPPAPQVVVVEVSIRRADRCLTDAFEQDLSYLFFNTFQSAARIVASLTKSISLNIDVYHLFQSAARIVASLTGAY